MSEDDFLDVTDCLMGTQLGKSLFKAFDASGTGSVRGHPFFFVA